MITTLMILHAIISVMMIGLVLIQFGKGAEAGLMSGGASDSVFSGAQQSNFLSKTTTVVAALFLGNSIYLAKLQSHRSAKSILDSEAPMAAPLNRDSANPAATPNAAATPDTSAKADDKAPAAAPKAEAQATPEAQKPKQ